jgi:hypothetical protein
MAASVTISVDTIEGTLPVPLQAVFRDRSVNYVWKQTPAGMVHTRIKVGRQNTERVEVLEGVAEGDVLALTPPAGVQPPKFEQPVAPEPAPLKATERPGENGGANGNGDGPRGPRGPGSGAAMNKKLAEMTPEELEAYKGRLDGMTRMVDGARQNGNLEVANEIEQAITALRAALDKNDLKAGQEHQDKLRAATRRLMGGGRGPGGNGEGGGRRGGNNGGGEGGNGGGGRRGGG